jgi:tetratricopeptide (TPR) repeat protein
MSRPNKRRRERTPTSGGLLPRRPTAVQARRRPQDGAWELVHPRCARERAEDIEEVQLMLDAGEVDIAVDELRWLLSGCADFIQAHLLLGEIALEENRLRLARGHFGRAFELGYSALPERLDAPVPYRLPANQPFLQAAKGLAWCLHKLNKNAEALAVVEVLLACDPTDPLGVGTWRHEWAAKPSAGPGDQGRTADP